MRRICLAFFGLILAQGFAAPASADTLAKIKKRGTLVAGVKDSLPPFGFVDTKAREIVGYDVDFARAIAKKLGVKLELKSVTSANRLPMLSEGNVDIVVATTTKTPERMQQVDFSHMYFLTGQRFLTKKGQVKSLKDLETARIGSTKGSNSETNAAKALPKAKIVSFDDYPQAVLAMQQGKVQAVTTDEAILAGLLAKIPDKDKYEIPEIQITEEPYGIVVKKGEAALLKVVNEALLEMEKSGEAAKIFNHWFSPTGDVPLKRNFKITPNK